MCPFEADNCGDQIFFNFTDVGDFLNVNISLPQGDTCTYHIMAYCGLPSFAPNDTTGFEIETVDYDDDDLAAATAPPPPVRRRILQNTTDEDTTDDSTDSPDDSIDGENSTEDEPDDTSDDS